MEAGCVEQKLTGSRDIESGLESQISPNSSMKWDNNSVYLMGLLEGAKEMLVTMNKMPGMLKNLTNVIFIKIKFILLYY